MKVRGWRPEQGFWPTEIQEQVLKAALFPPEQAEPIWGALAPSFDIEHLEWETTMMLPMVFRNLEGANALGAEEGRFRGLYRRSWYMNQRIYFHLRQVLMVLAEAGIATMVLKGVALTETHYRDRGVRGMFDFDVLVPTSEARRASEILMGHSWVPMEWITRFGDEVTPELMRRVHEFSLSAPDRPDCDLHWHLDLDLVGSDAAFAAIKDVWDRSIPLTIDNVDTRMMDPADAFVHTCIHGTKREGPTRTRWVADAYKLATSVDRPVDWNQVVATTISMCSVQSVRAASCYLVERFDVPIPEHVLRTLWSVRTGMRDRLLFRGRWRVPPETRLGRAERLLYKHTSLHRDAGTLTFFSKMPEVVKDHWQLSSTSQIPKRAAVAFLRAVRKQNAGPDRGG